MIHIFFKQLRYVLCIVNQYFILSLIDLFIVLLIDLVIISAIIHAYKVMLRTSILKGLVTPANAYVPEGKRTKVCRNWLSGDKIYLL